MFPGDKGLNEFEHPIIGYEIAFQLAVMQNRLKHLFWGLDLQVKQQHADIVKPSAGAVIPHQFDDATVTLIIANFVEQLHDAFFRALKDLQDVTAVREQDTRDVQFGIAASCSFYQRA